MPNKHFDLVILGSGPTAFAAALRAQEFGKTAVMTEERTIGGTCVNRGCLPSKNLIEAAKIIHDARHPRYPGVSPAELGLDFRKLIEQKDDVIHGENGEAAADRFLQTAVVRSVLEFGRTGRRHRLLHLLLPFAHASL